MDFSHAHTPWCFHFTLLLRALYVCLRVPAGHLAGTHKAAVFGGVEPFDAAKYSPDAADGGEPREPHPGCSEPAKNKNVNKMFVNG